MKSFSVLLSFILSFYSNAQIPKTGTYTYKYCDIEYNKCVGNCQIKIKGNKIWVYAPPNLLGIKEGELFESGILSKHQSGKWTIINPEKNKSVHPSDAKDVFV